MNENQPSTFLIAGLGNPGREYRSNRHNLGFMLLDRLAERLAARFARMEMKALVTHASYEDNRLILVKPQTYMNLSGQAIGSLLQFYKIPNDRLMVVFDDIDLPWGMLRLRPAGGSAGQKGMQSIIERLGTQEFPRLRIGISRPPGRMEAGDYVLQDFSREETELLPAILERGVEAVLAFIKEGIVASMNQYNPDWIEDRE
jgi:PTH1 family peptidyl-tRNA hydrolase